MNQICKFRNDLKGAFYLAVTFSIDDIIMLSGCTVLSGLCIQYIQLY